MAFIYPVATCQDFFNHYNRKIPSLEIPMDSPKQKTAVNLHIRLTAVCCFLKIAFTVQCEKINFALCAMTVLCSGAIGNIKNGVGYENDFVIHGRQVLNTCFCCMKGEQ